MVDRCLRGLMIPAWAAVLLALVVPVAIAAAPPAGGDSNSGLRTHPTAGMTPVLVSLGLYITNVSDIDEATETFEVQGYLYSRWLDQRLAAPDPAGKNDTRTIDENAIWTPRLEIANLISLGFSHEDTFADSRGMVYRVLHFGARLSDQFALRRFPFDTQKLLVVIQPYVHPANRRMTVTFAPEDLASGISHETYAGLAGWEISDIDYQTQVVSISGLHRGLPEAEFEIVVKRRSGFYWWKVFLPVLIMVAVSWSIFWVATDEFDWQMKIPIATMLAMVAFEFAIGRDLPRVSYITFLDAILLTSFIFIFLAMMECVAVHVMVRENRLHSAERFQQASRWIFPLAYVCVVLILVPLFFVSAGGLR